jgi:Zn-dependent membrane protease YugP
MLWGLLIILVLVVVFGPAIWVKWVMRAHSEEIPGMPGNGGQLATHLLKNLGIDASVEITEVGDHYDPSDKAVRLTRPNYEGKSLTAIAVAAHEVGHIIKAIGGWPSEPL